MAEYRNRILLTSVVAAIIVISLAAGTYYLLPSSTSSSALSSSSLTSLITAPIISTSQTHSVSSSLSSSASSAASSSTLSATNVSEKTANVEILSCDSTYTFTNRTTSESTTEMPSTLNLAISPSSPIEVSSCRYIVSDTYYQTSCSVFCSNGSGLSEVKLYDLEFNISINNGANSNLPAEYLARLSIANNTPGELTSIFGGSITSLSVNDLPVSYNATEPCLSFMNTTTSAESNCINQDSSTITFNIMQNSPTETSFVVNINSTETLLP